MQSTIHDGFRYQFWRGFKICNFANIRADAADRTALDKVFDITELHESILSHLPPKDVLLAQRVSKTWKATINGSLMLQRALGFVASSNSFVTTSNSDTDYFSRQKPSLSTGMTAAQFIEASDKPGACVINPLLECLCEKKDSDDLFLPPGTELATLVKDKRSSLNRIRLTQPPVAYALVGWRCTCVREDLFPGDIDANEIGQGGNTTFRDLFKELHSIRERACSGLSEFCLRV